MEPKRHAATEQHHNEDPPRPTDIQRHAGNADLWTAVGLSADAVARGVPLHLHAEGPRGTGKTSVLRAVGRRLPAITRITGCPYNCDPDAPHCPLHRHLPAAAVESLGAERLPAPFLELSASAKLATAVGAIDLARLLDRERPEAALLPGTLARAHRGVLFVDEINRLADVAPELTDALLDVMGSKPGRLQIEEAGLPPVELTVAATVWAASNPDEEPGPLDQTRLQLADRFDLRVAVSPPTDPDVVLAVLRSSADHGAGPAVPQPQPLWDSISDAAIAAPASGTPDAPVWPAALLRLLAEAYVETGLGSLRALRAWQQAAEGLTRRAGRDRIAAADVRLAARLTLRGRVDPATLEASLGAAASDDAGAIVTADSRGAVAEARERSAEAAEATDGAWGEGQSVGPPTTGDREVRAPVPAPRIGEVRPLVAPEWTGSGAGPAGRDAQ